MTDMNAVQIRAPGGPEVLEPCRRPRPRPAPGEVLIRVAAAGVNRPDIVQREGHYDPPPGASDLPGLEVSGEVAALGEGVDGFAIGERVCALLAGGGYAEYVVAPGPQVLPVPDGVDMVGAAALPETVFTVWSNLCDRVRLASGERLLVHGGASGIGTTAIQLATALGARVLATAGSAAKVELCERLGAERAINYREEDFVEVVASVTGGAGVDVILDMVGGDYLPRNIRCLATEGRHVSIAFLRGPKVELNFMRVMLKRLTLTGSTLRARSVEEKGAIARQVRSKVWPLVADGRVRPVIDACFDLADAADAHRRMDAPDHAGKVVLTMGGC